MKGLLTILILCGVLGGAHAQASLAYESKKSSHMTLAKRLIYELNQEYPGLNLKLSCPDSPAFGKQVLMEVMALEEMLYTGEEYLPPGALMTLACSNAACGGTGAGPCRTCMVTTP